MRGGERGEHDMVSAEATAVRMETGVCDAQRTRTRLYTDCIMCDSQGLIIVGCCNTYEYAHNHDKAKAL